jgi:hypothetical protein
VTLVVVVVGCVGMGGYLSGFYRASSGHAVVVLRVLTLHRFRCMCGRADRFFCLSREDFCEGVLQRMCRSAERGRVLERSRLGGCGECVVTVVAALNLTLSFWV